jgi:5-methyltetrahydrofolate--homocysteine methyltransferase
VRLDVPPHPIPYRERIVRDIPQLREIWSYISPQMLYVKHMGFKGNFERRLAERDPKALELHEIIEGVKDEAAGFMKVRAVWQFFEAESAGNAIRVFEPGKNGLPLHEFRFPRQRREDGLSLADYVMPAQQETRDSMAVFVVGAGEGVRERSEGYKERGEYVKSHAIQALALETAEACAEWLHRRIREDWGFPDPAETTMLDRMKARYRSRRYSFGYAACPNLEDQEGLFKLIRPEDIGVRLTEGYMMDPEASVSAIVLAHPDCTYFDVDK